MDKTARRLRDICSELHSDEHIVEAIGRAFSGASLSTKRRGGERAGADIGEIHDANESDDDPELTGDPAPREKSEGCTYWEHFRTFPAVGPFKAMFALYYLERFALSRTVRLQAMAEGDKLFVAGWGVGMALGELCPSLAHELPQRQRDDSAVNTRKCTALYLWFSCMLAFPYLFLQGNV